MRFRLGQDEFHHQETPEAEVEENILLEEIDTPTAVVPPAVTEPNVEVQVPSRPITEHTVPPTQSTATSSIVRSHPQQKNKPSDWAAITTEASVCMNRLNLLQNVFNHYCVFLG